MWWVYVEHAYTDAADEDHEIELACAVNGDGDVVDVRLAEIGPDGHYRPLPAAVDATIDDQDLHATVRRQLGARR